MMFEILTWNCLTRLEFSAGLGARARVLGAPLAWSAAFALGDWLLFSALPGLGLSYGGPRWPWVIAQFFRLLLLAPSLITWLIWLPNARRLLKTWVVLSALLWVPVIYGFYVEPLRLTVTHQALTAPAFQALGRLRLVQLTDTHVERTTVRERALVAQVQALQPDVILLTGDYVNANFLQDPLARRDTRALLAQLHARYGVYAISGTVDDADMMQALFDGLAITVIDNRAVAVDVGGARPLYLMGLADAQSHADAVAVLHTLRRAAPAGAPTVLLNHTPEMIDAAAAEDVDLYLAGHTHGGQVRLPFYGGLFTFGTYSRRFEAGNYQVGPTQAYVSRGLGLEGLGDAPRVRFLCPPEIVALEH